MKLEIDVVDAFTDSVFSGNPAAVVIIKEWLPDEVMQNIATENNLSETAFIVRIEHNVYAIRWFSPITEISFCGHATLASAFVVFKRDPNLDSLCFVTSKVGELTVVKGENEFFEMNFPNTMPQIVNEIPEALIAGLSIPPSEVYKNSQAYFVVYGDESEVLSVERDNAILAELKPLDIVVTCKSETNKYDFISRYFWPANGGDEDPVTGSIHTGLVPLWATRLNKTKLIAYQASSRGGILQCELHGDRVSISGKAVQYLEGIIYI
ncbi:PhzF family phenazine biosynthesis protein [Alteromonas sp. 5E99-2]|uniref:PhzF family phenazine biosynthesis protein n=1 Tax=Alteromonas sp. 5E99-2 TaxID=2817683 RepID=UPI001A98F95D|nr:PhzF family phenazine biosynthesis protein [Alteromonas sp. 5E99-2]MBO1256980.1 PhzF family phenazine biosynthesis protein [Alteromonas sp. 5E99-2]